MLGLRSLPHPSIAARRHSTVFDDQRQHILDVGRLGDGFLGLDHTVLDDLAVPVHLAQLVFRVRLILAYYPDALHPLALSGLD
jgi:hypothetical protein